MSSLTSRFLVLICTLFWVSRSRRAALTLAGVVFCPSAAFAQTLNVSEGVQSYVSLANTTVTMTGKSELRITGVTNPISGTTINLNSPDAWFLMPGVRPATFASTYLGQIRVSGAAAVAGSNVRVVQYAMGTVVIPHAPSYQPLQTFTGPHFSGASQGFNQYTYYNTASALGAMNGTISSFKLKRGYMATFSTATNGTGPSKVYVAQDSDLDVAFLPSNLDNAVRYVRVFPWRWVSKKGSCDVAPETLNSAWYYNWNNNQTSTLNHEYVPIRQQRYWPGLPSNQPESMHLLGFNEPDNPVEDAYTSLNNGSVDTAIAVWPDLLASGLRVGAPAVTDGGTAWLYSFMDKAAAANLRVDYVPIHFYRANYTAQQLYDWLKAIHDRTGKPIWVTEFNNGANWTAGTDPTYAQNATRIGEFIEMMDNAPFVERYAVYSNVEAVRNMVYAEGGLTPAGVVYRDNASPIGYIQEPVPTVAGRRAVAQFPLDGNTLDTSGQGNHGIALGNPAYTTGKRGQALAFDGANSVVQLPENMVNSNAFSFAAWIYWDGGAANQCVFDFGDDATKTIYLMPTHSANGKMRFAMRNNATGGSQWIEAPAALTSGSWQHVAVTMSGTAAKIYLNGAQVASGTLTTAAVSGTSNNYFGKSQTAANPLFKGRLDDVLILDSVLTPAQIAAIQTNNAPQFGSSTINRGPAARGAAWSGTLAGSATDADNDAIVYSKTSGPAWLVVAPGGALSGTPTVASQGVQEFTVSATDSKGASAFAVLNVSLNDFYWRGDVSGLWNADLGGNTNWASDGAGTLDSGQVPDAATNILFAASNAANLPGTTLGADMAVRGITVASAAGVSIGGTHSLTLGAGGLTAATGSGATTLSTSGGVILGASQTWTNAASNALTVSSAISGANFGLTKAGTGQMTLSGDSNYDGGTTISSGTLSLGSGGTSGSVVGQINNNGTLLINRSNDLTLSGVISGTGALSKIGAGRLTLSNSNSYSGGTSIGTAQGAAILRAAGNNALGTGPLTFDLGANSSTARLELSGNTSLPNDITLPQRNNPSVAIQNISGSNRLSGAITLTAGGGNAIFQSDSGILTLSGAMSSGNNARTATLAGAGDGAISGAIANGAGSVAVVKNGAGTWTLSGDNLYSGTTTINAGMLATAGSDERISNASNMILSGGTFAPGTRVETLNALTLTGSTASRLDFGRNASLLRYNSLAAGAGTLIISNYVAGSDQFFIGTSKALTPSQLAQIKFSISGANYDANQLGSGEIVPVLPPVASGGLIISEFRFNGTTSSDEYVELYNTQGAPLNISGWKIRTNIGNGETPAFQTSMVPDGTIIPARGHFLFSGAGYTLNSYAAGDASLDEDVSDDSGVVLLNAGDAAQDTVGFASSAFSAANPAQSLRQGTGLAQAPGVSGAATGQHAFMRHFEGAVPKNSGDNASDFVLLSSDGAPASRSVTSAGNTTTTLIPAQLGSPNPEGLASPVNVNASVSVRLLSPNAGANAVPNRVRTGSGNEGTLLLRRTLQNNGSQAIRRVRLLMTRITSQGSPAGIVANQADVRLIASNTEIIFLPNRDAQGAIIPAGSPGAGTTSVTVAGTSLEAPSIATTTTGTSPSITTDNGGGLGASLSFDLVLPAPLQPGEETNYAFNLQIAKGGTYLVAFNILALSDAPTVPIQP